MDKRFFLALALSALVILLTQMLFPSARRPPSKMTSTDSSSIVSRSAAPAGGVGGVGGVGGEQAPPVPAPQGGAPVADSSILAAGSTTPAPLVAETLTVLTPKATYKISTIGAAPVSATLTGYEAMTPPGGSVQLARDKVPMLTFSLITRGDTVSLAQSLFSADTASNSLTEGEGEGEGGGKQLTFRTNAGMANIVISYTFPTDDYLIRVQGRVTGVEAEGSQILLSLPSGLRSQETDSTDNNNHLALAYKPVGKDAEGVAFSKLDTNERQPIAGPLRWVATKNKYFLLVLLSRTGQPPFSSAVFVGGPRSSKQATNAEALVTRPLAGDGSFAFELYTGPQEWRRLRGIGEDLVNVNPYGGFMRGFVQPFATLVMSALLWMHDRLQLSYGWVLVFFGVVVRLILWPLNQSAMRSNLKMQRLQPAMQELQKKYKKNPEKQQAEMMKLYKEHNMSPLSMFSGCLPMLIPMPVLFALFFVFQNTIEFRGVPFLWLPDISQKDPYYIIPVLMGVSMFLLSWIGMRGTPPNPQAKMMGYALPVMMTAFFINLASGLNLYYAVQNLAALPQQWLIAHERKKAVPAPPPARA